MEVLAISFAVHATAIVGTARIRTAIESAGGVITHANELSSWAIALTVEILGYKLRDLDNLLTQDGVVWLDNTESRLRKLAVELAETISNDVIVLMHVEFVSNEPERRIKVPMVPG
jgi:hypothetical protein